MYARLLAVALLAVVTACASKDPENLGPPPPQEFEASEDAMRNAVLDTFNELEITVDSGDPGRGLVRTAEKGFGARHPVGSYMNCGGDPALGPWTESPGFAGFYTLSLQFDDKSEGMYAVTVRASFRGSVGETKRDCASNGVFEREVLEKIDSHLN